MVVSNIFLFSPLFGEDYPVDQYFSDGLKPPTRYSFFEMGILFVFCIIIHSLQFLVVNLDLMLIPFLCRVAKFYGERHA